MLKPTPAVTGLKGGHKLVTVPKHAFLKFILLIYRITGPWLSFNSTFSVLRSVTFSSNQDCLSGLRKRENRP